MTKKKKEKTQEYKQFIEIMVDALENKGWTIAVCQPEADSDSCPGVIVGTQDYVNYVVSKIEDKPVKSSCGGCAGKCKEKKAKKK